MLAELGGDTPELDSTAIDGELSTEVDVPRILVSWIGESPGNLCFLRPDQWRLPSESEMARAVNAAVQSGRRVRAIYPARALQEAPAILMGRAAIGEQIRVLPDVPTRMAIIGATRAMLPEPLGVGNQRRILIRQQSIVQVLTAWFDQLWDSATVREHARPRRGSPRPAAAAARPARRAVRRTSRSRARSTSACAPCAGGSPR